MAPELKYLFIDCICPHHDIITSTHRTGNNSREETRPSLSTSAKYCSKGHT